MIEIVAWCLLQGIGTNMMLYTNIDISIKMQCLKGQLADCFCIAKQLTTFNLMLPNQVKAIKVLQSRSFISIAILTRYLQCGATKGNKGRRKKITIVQ